MGVLNGGGREVLLASCVAQVVFSRAWMMVLADWWLSCDGAL